MAGGNPGQRNNDLVVFADGADMSAVEAEWQGESELFGGQSGGGEDWGGESGGGKSGAAPAAPTEDDATLHRPGEEPDYAGAIVPPGRPAPEERGEGADEGNQLSEAAIAAAVAVGIDRDDILASGISTDQELLQTMTLYAKSSREKSGSGDAGEASSKVEAWKPPEGFEEELAGPVAEVVKSLSEHYETRLAAQEERLGSALQAFETLSQMELERWLDGKFESAGMPELYGTGPTRDLPVGSPERRAREKTKSQMSTESSGREANGRPSLDDDTLWNTAHGAAHADQIANLTRQGVKAGLDKRKRQAIPRGGSRQRSSTMNPEALAFASMSDRLAKIRARS